MEYSHFNKLYEAEDAILEGVKVSKDILGFNGNGYVTGFTKPDNNVVFNVNVPSNGLYLIKISYEIPKESGPKRTLLIVNGTYTQSLRLKELNKFTETNPQRILLKKGKNNIMILSDWGYYNIDYIRVESGITLKKYKLESKLVNPEATEKTKDLMRFLLEINGKFILSGQQEYSEVSWLYEKIKKKPAVVGFDFMEYSPSKKTYGSTYDQTEQAIQWDKEGGIVTFSWHWNAPKDLLGKVDGKWVDGFRTEGTTFNIQYALDNPSSNDYKLLLRDIDAIAIQLKRLQKANVPVLFRPLHEAEGGWFWWGAKGPEPAKELYRLIYDRITNYHKINNIIWVWNSSAKEWYPGNKYVDIVSYDSYPDAGDYRPLIEKYGELTSLVHNKKLVALSENGPIPDPNLLKEYQVNWSWFLTWQDKFLKDGKTNSLEHLSDVYNNDYVITLDKLQKYKIYSSK
ncbi:glycosyl hydrolase [Priestia megaterium]|uniref:glycosyl hydrolase n=1 Tax=Priestia megaterium TaxID=1404 RepID=UPI0030F4AF72